MSPWSRVLWSACILACALTSGGCQQQRRGPVANAQKAPTELEQIEALEDRRSLGSGQLAHWALTSPDAEVRTRALRALARIQAPQTAEIIASALEDPEPVPRSEAAFAAGVLGTWSPLPEAVRDQLVEKLLVAEAKETALPVRQAKLEALGTIATSAAVERLVERLQGSSPDLQAQAAMSLGLAARRGAQLPPTAITVLSSLVRAEAAPAGRFGAAYALAMSKLPSARPALLLCTDDEQSEVRLLCARGLGDAGTDADAVTLGKGMEDADWRVAVEATRALAKLAGRCTGAACPALDALAGLTRRLERLEAGDVAGGGQPLLALAQQGLPASGRALLVTLRGRIVSASRTAAGTLKDDLANLDCRLAAALDRQSGQLEEVLSCGSGLIPEPQRLALGLGEIARTPPANPEQRVRQVLGYLSYDDRRVRSAAIEVLGEAQSPSAAEHLRPFIDGEDLPLAVGAADAAGRIRR